VPLALQWQWIASSGQNHQEVHPRLQRDGVGQIATAALRLLVGVGTCMFLTAECLISSPPRRLAMTGILCRKTELSCV
jgi:hypothetical protein